MTTVKEVRSYRFEGSYVAVPVTHTLSFRTTKDVEAHKPFVQGDRAYYPLYSSVAGAHNSRAPKGTLVWVDVTALTAELEQGKNVFLQSSDDAVDYTGGEGKVLLGTAHQYAAIGETKILVELD